MSANGSNENLARRLELIRRARVVPAILVLLAARAQASVVHVSGSGDALSNAVNAAVDGDTLVVMDGTYSGFTLDGLNGKGLTIVADTHATVTVTSMAIVRNIPTGHDTLISGLQFTGGLQVLDCACAIRLQSVLSYGPAPGASLFPGLNLSNDPDVAAVRCTLRGSFSGAFPALTSATDAVDAGSCNVALYDCLVQGGAGNSALGKSFPASAGAIGLYAVNSSVLASNCQFIGGNGGSGNFAYCLGAAGGDAIFCYGSGSVPALCYLRDSSEQGGSGGFSFCGPAAPDGAALEFSGYAFPVSLPAAHRRLEAPALVHENTLIPLVFSGVPGDRVTLFYSKSTRFELSTQFQGVFLYGTAARSARMGTIPDSGVLSVTLLVPDLAPGVEAGSLYLQGIVVDSAGEATLSSPAFSVVLDSAF